MTAKEQKENIRQRQAEFYRKMREKGLKRLCIYRVHLDDVEAIKVFAEKLRKARK